MNEYSYFSILQDLQFKLDRNHKLEIKRLELQPGPGYKKISDFLQRINFKASDEVIKFYGEIESVYFEWKSKRNAPIEYLESDNSVFGRIEILSIENSLFGLNKSKGWKDAIWFDDMSSSDIEFYQSIRPFDFYFPDQGEMVCFQVINNMLNDNLFLYGDEIGLSNMSIGIKRYVEFLAQTGGMMFWQQALVFKGGNERKRVKYYTPLLLGSRFSC